MPRANDRSRPRRTVSLIPDRVLIAVLSPPLAMTAKAVLPSLGGAEGHAIRCRSLTQSGADFSANQHFCQLHGGKQYERGFCRVQLGLIANAELVYEDFRSRVEAEFSAFVARHG